MDIGLGEKFLRRLREKRKNFEKMLLDGSCKTFEDYKSLVARIKSFNEAEEIMKECFKGILEE